MQQKINSDNIAPSAKGWLIYADGKLRGAAFPIHSGRNTIGRNEGDVRLTEDASVLGKEHCVIYYDEVKYEFSVIPRDLNTVKVNGEFVNRNRLLNDRDMLCIGKTNLIFREQAAANVERWRLEERQERLKYLKDNDLLGPGGVLYGCPNADMIEFSKLLDRKKVEIIDYD